MVFNRWYLVAGLVFLLAASVYSAVCGFDIACSLDQNFSTASDITPPTISAVTASGITNTSADINWNTNEDANSLLQYGLTTAYGLPPRIDVNFSSPKHVAGLVGLTAGTIYHYRITACDLSRNCTTTGDFTFSTTGSSDVTPPVISNVQVTNIIDRNATISFTTNELSDTNIQYDVNTAPGFSFSLFDPAFVNGARSKVITGLTPLTAYKYRVASRDTAGNAAAFVFGTPIQFTTTDILPFISGITITSVTSNSATVQWNTDINADSQIEYGTTSGYGFTTTRDTTPLRVHSQVMSGLNPNTIYHFRVLAKRCSIISC